MTYKEYDKNGRIIITEYGKKPQIKQPVPEKENSTTTDNVDAIDTTEKDIFEEQKQTKKKR
jgi:hypothetical protein